MQFCITNEHGPQLGQNLYWYCRWQSLAYTFTPSSCISGSVVAIDKLLIASQRAVVYERSGPFPAL